MKKLFLIPALLGFILYAGCDSMVDSSDIIDGLVSNELVDPDKRVNADDVNAHVYGSFSNLSFTYTVGTAGGIGPIASGPALGFQGNPNNAGTCENGLWINRNGGHTSGTMEKPHPHCVGPVGGVTEESMVVVLEPISARNRQVGSDNENLQLAADRPDGDVRLQGGGPSTQGRGTIVAWAIDKETLGTTNTRVGKLTIDLTQYTAQDTNFFLENCNLGGPEAPRCLNKVITASFVPEPEFASILEDRTVTGFLYWSPADAPFNYTE